jgi:NarL family two-component system sensor histidine kinase LiaS
MGMVTAVPSIDFDFIRRLLPIILISLGVFSLGVAGIGTIFGYFTSRGLVSRIQGLSEATHQWQKGHFDEIILDEHTDELADLGNQMNNMAKQLSELIDKRKMLAVIEERNRIARDLHDSVKQKTFAAAGQINGAKAVISKHPGKASDYLSEADDLLHEIRNELTVMINELKPIELQEKTLQEAIGNYLENWSKRNGIEIKFSSATHLDLDEETETAVFRLIQEATSNIARHSRAEHALVHISRLGSTIEILITDDGIGFEVESQYKGFGLGSIKERFESNQTGSVEINSIPGEGTAVRVLMKIQRGK